MVRYEVGVTDGFTVGVGLHQGSALSPLLFAVEVDTLKDEVRLESSWIMVRIVSWRKRTGEIYGLERIGMEGSITKTDYMCTN